MQPIEKDDERAQLYTMATVDLLNTVNHGSGEEPIDFDDEEDKDEAQSHFKDDYSTEIHSSFIQKDNSYTTDDEGESAGSNLKNRVPDIDYKYKLSEEKEEELRKKDDIIF